MREGPYAIYCGRSRQIRDRLASWLRKTVGKPFKTMKELQADAANYSGCSMVTAARWVYQFTAPGQKYKIMQTKDAFTIRTRKNGGNGGKS